MRGDLLNEIPPDHIKSTCARVCNQNCCLSEGNACLIREREEVIVEPESADTGHKALDLIPSAAQLNHTLSPLTWYTALRRREKVSLLSGKNEGEEAHKVLPVKRSRPNS